MGKDGRTPGALLSCNCDFSFQCVGVPGFAQKKEFPIFPIVPLFSAACAALGITGLFWYYLLPKAEQERADRLATHYAMILFNKALGQLTAQEMRRVNQEVKGHFTE